MSSVTKKVIIDDIILKLTEASPTDDFSIPRSQISYVLDTARDKIVGDAIYSDLRKGEIPNAIYIEKEAGKAISSEDDGSVECAIRHYVTLTKDPIWVINDRGIMLVQFSNGTKAEPLQSPAKGWTSTHIPLLPAMSLISAALSMIQRNPENPTP